MASEKQIFEKGESNGKSVGIIGSGPAGLSCAAYLARLGYEVTVYERKPMAGGLDTYGMAEYKMSQSVSQNEVDQVAKLGVKFLLNTCIVAGDDLDIVGDMNKVSFDLLREWHDAVFVGIGLGQTHKLHIAGEELH